MKEWDLDRVLGLLDEAARIALHYFDFPSKEFKQDLSLVTQADREIEAMLAKELDKPQEGVFLIGEETVETKSESYLEEALRGRTWIIDPIDGTSSYANHLMSWGISIAYAEGGKIREGSIYLPVAGKLLITDRETVYASAWRRECGEGKPELKPHRPIVPQPPFEAGVVAVDQENARKGHGLPGTVHASGSCVFALLHLFMGGYVSYIANARLWDLASGAALMEKLGFLGRFEDGEPYTTRLDPFTYQLSPGAGAKRWKTRGRIVFSGSEEGLSYTMEGLRRRNK